MKSRCVTIDEAASSEIEVAVVVDVLRAFTTAAYAFRAGGTQIAIVPAVEEAFALKTQHPDWLLMGEQNRGMRVDGFDFTNSPVEVSNADLSSRCLVQRTSHGTMGVAASLHAERIYCASLVTASATAKLVGSTANVAYVITGIENNEFAEEDLACAQYIEAIRQGELLKFDVVERVRNSIAAANLMSHPEWAHPLDVSLARILDTFDFAIEANRIGDTTIAKPARP